MSPYLKFLRTFRLFPKYPVYQLSYFVGKEQKYITYRNMASNVPFPILINLLAGTAGSHETLSHFDCLLHFRHPTKTLVLRKTGMVHGTLRGTYN